MPAVSTSSLSDAFDRLRLRLGRAAERAGRSLNDVEILAVTKFQPPERVQEVLRLGLRQLAESRVQEAAAKREAYLRPYTPPVGFTSASSSMCSP